ncbi:MAG: hypothetical protein NC340_08055 [Ruminococcus flavefaciens]|nr:hypothetical protein [Ruminococcus flavefaciens]MCM1229931.1 hypothetical protein [Ruminococcus flavefaciens]
MKKSIILIIPAVLSLVSCGNSSKNPEDYVRAENFVVYPEYSLPQTDILPEISEPEVIEPKVISYNLKDTDVELLVDGEVVKTLKHEYIPDTNNIIIGDFNYDGYDDIFVPYENSTSGGSIFGDYYCYIPIENNFTKNSELAKMGKLLTIAGNDILSEKLYDSYNDVLMEYKWTDGKLKPFRKTELYTSVDDYQQHRNIYSYTEDGSEYLESST